MVAIPDGPKGLDCHRGRGPTHKACKKCPLWMQAEITTTKIDGTQEKATDWVCGDVKSVFLQVELLAYQKEIIRRILGNQGATEGLRNELIKRMDAKGYAQEQLDLIDAIRSGNDQPDRIQPKLIEAN